MKQVTIYTDGACIGNPGPGGYGVVLIYDRPTKGVDRMELSGGFKLTTNNRMELTAVITALRALHTRCDVTLRSDSEYIVTWMRVGLPKRWRERNWRGGKRGRIQNPDLWQQVLDLCDKHDIVFEMVKGHDGDRENDRCDELARLAARSDNLPADTMYEESNPPFGARRL